MFRLLGLLALASLCSTSGVPDEHRLLAASQVADMLGVTKWWVYNRFEVPPIKIGRLSRWEPWRIQAYIDAHRAEVVR